MLTDVSIETASYDLPTNKHFEQLSLDYSFYIKKAEEFHDNCEAIKENLVFINGYSRFSDTTLINREVYRHPLEGKKCIMLYSRKHLFLNAEDASLIYYTSKIHYWDKLPWMAQIKLNYDFYQSRICDLASFYKRSDKKGYLIRYNLCAEEIFVQGQFLFDSEIMITR